jgi:hypothetical protein
MHTRRQFGVAVLGLAVLALLLAGTGRAQAGFMVTLLEQNGNVVANGGGSIDLNGLTLLGPTQGTAGMTPTSGFITLGAFADGDVYNGFTGPPSFGSGAGIQASSGSGDLFSINSSNVHLKVPSGYVSGHSLSDTSTYLNKTFSSLGVTPGTYVWTWGTGAHADSFTLQIGPAATAAPEPASLTLAATGALGLLGYGWRKRRQSVA